MTNPLKRLWRYAAALAALTLLTVSGPAEPAAARAVYFGIDRISCDLSSDDPDDWSCQDVGVDCYDFPCSGNNCCYVHVQ